MPLCDNEGWNLEDEGNLEGREYHDDVLMLMTEIVIVREVLTVMKRGIEAVIEEIEVMTIDCKWPEDVVIWSNEKIWMKYYEYLYEMKENYYWRSDLITTVSDNMTNWQMTVNDLIIVPIMMMTVLLVEQWRTIERWLIVKIILLC